MLADWIKAQTTEEDRPEAGAALSALAELVEAASEADLPALLAELTGDPRSELVEVPLYDQDATETLVRIIDRLAPDPEQAETLAQRFRLTWAVSVMGGPGFEARPLLNGVLLVRNMHRVLGPNLHEGVILEADPDLIETLAADLDTLRARNLAGDPSCFLFTHDAQGARLIGSEEPVDLAAPGWGQLIAVCAFSGEDLEGEAALQCEALREVAARARSGVVFLRFYGDRFDLIPASRYDDDLDIFLEELAAFDLGEQLEAGTEIQTPLQGEALIAEIIERAGYETGHLPEDGPGGTWFRTLAMPALAKRLASAMTWSTANFGLGPDPDGPRRGVPLPTGIEELIAADPDLKRRSVTLEVMTFSETARDLVLEGLIGERIAETFEEVGAYDLALTITGRVDHELRSDPGVPPLTGPEELAEAFSAALETIAARAEEEGEEDLREAVINASLGVVLLVDFPEERPSDLTLAAAASALSAALEGTVRLFLNGRGEYLAYDDGGEDSGDHGLFRLADEDDEDQDEEGEDPDEEDQDDQGAEADEDGEETGDQDEEEKRDD